MATPKKQAPKKKPEKNEFTAHLEMFEGNLWYYHVMVPEDIARNFVNGTDRRVVCTLNGHTSFQGGLMPKKGGLFFININKKIREELGLRMGSEVHVKLEKDKSDYGLPMPEELEELLKMDDDGNRLFHQLTPGKQRTLLYMVGLPKNPDLRITRAICVVEHLKENQGKINYRLLGEAFKNPR